MRWRTLSRTITGRYVPHFLAPNGGGVYAWYGDGVLFYVGSSERLSLRIADYFSKRAIAEDGAGFITPWGTVRELDLKVSGSRFFGDWATRELRLIRRLRPKGNRRSVRAAHQRRTGARVLGSNNLFRVYERPA